MKFYVTKYSANGCKRIHWEGTQADATSKRKALKEEDCDNITTIEFDVPTDKPGLLAFLNQYVTGELSVEQAAEMLHQLGLNPQIQST
jgi:hypothetical protein